MASEMAQTSVSNHLTPWATKKSILEATDRTSKPKGNEEKLIPVSFS